MNHQWPGRQVGIMFAMVAVATMGIPTAIKSFGTRPGKNKGRYNNKKPRTKRKGKPVAS